MTSDEQKTEGWREADASRQQAVIGSELKVISNEGVGLEPY